MKRLLILLFISASIISCSNKKVKELSPAEFKKQLELLDEYQLVDVSSKEEFEKRHIPGSINIDYYSPNLEIDIENLNPYVPIFVYCELGGRSKEFAKLLKQKKFEKIYILKGGIDRWEKEGYPVESVKP